MVDFSLANQPDCRDPAVNAMINQPIEAIGIRGYKTYRIYREQLPC